MRVTVTAGSRLHFSLVDLGRATPRCYGGSGLMLSEPAVVVTSEPSATWEISDHTGVDPRGIQDIHRTLLKLEPYSEGRATHVTIVAAPPQHSGFGLKTAILLATAEASTRALDFTLLPAQLQKIVGRGGTSGVGIHGFFHGGLVVDCGHSQPDVLRLGPSSATEPRNPPSLVGRYSFPDSWRAVLLLRDQDRLTDSQELKVFEKCQTLQRTETLDALAATYHGVIPSVLNEDLPGLRRALRELNSIGFKRLEWAAQATGTQELYTEVTAIDDIASGLSSMGPLVFCIVHRDDLESATRLRDVAARHKARVLGPVSAKNDGRTISNDA